VNGTGDAVPPRIDDAWLRTLSEQIADASGLLACFDYDGTLAPIVSDPDAAAISPAVREPLSRLADAPAVEVAVVSGRSLPDLRERVGIDGVRYVGNHGLEWDDGTGRTVLPAARASRPPLQRAVDALREELADIPGCFIEDKRLTATVHYRRTPSAHVPDVLDAVDRAAEASDALRITRGKAVRELRPVAAAGKGRAVERLRKRRPDDLPIFVGDDRTDEDGFRAVADDGYGVLVGRRADSAAAVRVPDVDGVARLLAALLTRCPTDRP